ncbi:MAG: DUF2784 family protein [Alphaproteobacteria bacterium]
MAPIDHLTLLDWIFHTLHLGVIIINLFAWIPKATRKLHRYCVLLTAFSWLCVGLFVGKLGYCFLTDWHWQVKIAAGTDNLPGSYITYLANQAGFFPAADTVDIAVAASFLTIIVIAFAQMVYERSKR